MLFGSTAACSAASRLLSIAAFAAVQQLVFVPPSLWLRADASEPADPNPFFQNSPLAGVTFAFIFAVPVATAAQLIGLQWLPAARPWSADAALFALISAVSDEVSRPSSGACCVASPDHRRPFGSLTRAHSLAQIFFRAWLLTAVTRAGGSAAAALIVSTTLFGIFHVPVSQVLASEGSSRLLLYQGLGAYLSFLYQRSGGSLPLAAVTHCTCNLLVLALRAAQVDSVLPF